MKYLQSFPFLFSSLKDSELIMLDTLTEKKEYKKDTVLLEKKAKSQKN